MTSFFDLTLPQLRETLQVWGEPAYRAQQIWQAAYHSLAATPEAITAIPKALRQKLAAELAWDCLTPVTTAASADGQTRKVLYRLADGNAVEAVLMEYTRRRTVCISTQAGCALGCVFCATGKMGFKRNLTAGEIVAQVTALAREVKSWAAALPRGEPLLTNIVIMGMGEPLLNYEATLKAVDILNDPAGFNCGERRITISTVGLPPQLERLAAEKRQFNLAVSLHAATDALRSQLVPINRKYPLRVLFAAIRRYTETTRRRVTLEWALIQDVNDTPEQAHALAQLAAGLLCHINLIPLNPTRAYAGTGSPHERAEAFKAIVEGHRLPCTIRVRRGVEIGAGCGQLAGQETKT